MFERFWRSDQARSQPGSGLGLAIAAQVAEMHGARISADNAPGGGAQMTVVFPAA